MLTSGNALSRALELSKLKKVATNWKVERTLGWIILGENNSSNLIIPYCVIKHINIMIQIYLNLLKHVQCVGYKEQNIEKINIWFTDNFIIVVSFCPLLVSMWK